MKIGQAPGNRVDSLLGAQKVLSQALVGANAMPSEEAFQRPRIGKVH
jgi:hypothetical protein